METTGSRLASVITNAALLIAGAGSWLTAFPALAQPSLADLLTAEAPGPEPARAEPGTALSSAKTGVPPKKHRSAAEQKLRDAFAGHIAAASTAEAKQQLATRFLDLGLANVDSTERWVLFTESLSLAIDAADIPLTEKVIGEINASYVVDVHEARLATYTKLAQSRNLVASAKLIQALVNTARAAADESRFQTAEKAIKLAIAQARKQRNVGLVRHITGVQKAIATQQKAEQELGDLKKQLAASPNDASLATQVGKKLCFNADDWEGGLPLLAKGSDTALARLAEATLALPESPPKIVAVAEAWWQWAEGQEKSVRGKAQQKAVSLFRKAVPNLTGLDRAVVEKRIAEAGTSARGLQGNGKIAYLVDLPAPKHANMHSYSINGTYGGKKIVCQKRHFPKAIIAVPKSGSTATVTCTVPSNAVAFVGAVSLFTIESLESEAVWQIPAPAVFEIYIDGVRAWQSGPVKDSKLAIPFALPLAAPQNIELRVVYKSRDGLCLSAWLDPHFVL